MGVAGDGQLAVCDDDHVRVHAAGSEAACDVALHGQERDRILAHVQVGALGAVPVTRVRGKVYRDLVRAGGHSELPVGRRADARAVAVEVVEAVGLARRCTAAGGEVDARVAVTIPAVVEASVAAGGEARAVVEDGIGGISVAVVVAWSPVAFRTRAGVRCWQGRTEVELRGHGCLRVAAPS